MVKKCRLRYTLGGGGHTGLGGAGLNSGNPYLCAYLSGGLWVTTLSLEETVGEGKR